MEEFSKYFLTEVQDTFKGNHHYTKWSTRWSSQPQDEGDWRAMENSYVWARINDTIANEYYKVYKNNLNYNYHVSQYYKNRKR